ncbi:MAG: alpha-2-macroglobulin, partial [Saprospiraceae bacterium]|nr:alpha-2-macroglobulin [Saprospiraceae bacterium]
LGQWAKTEMKSTLSLNENLKLSDLNETPWVRNAISEEKNMQELSLYLDENHVSNQLENLARKLKQRQQINGGFSWYPGGRDNWYITQYVLESLGKLKVLGLMENNDLMSLLSSSVQYIDERILTYYKKIDKDQYDYADSNILHYYYVRSLFREIPIANHVYPAFNYFKGKLADKWTSYNSYQQALLSIAFHRWNELANSDKIFRSLSERMVQDEELGNYWNDQAGYYWFNSDISKQAAMIELFRLKNSDQSLIDGLKLWLLRNKQVNSWKTSKATASAVYAFMLDSDQWLTLDGEINILLPSNSKRIDFENVEFATGYGRKDYLTGIDSELGLLKVSNNSKQLCWGAAYWQYFEDLDNIQKLEDNPLSISKQVFRLGVDDNGLTLEEIEENNVLTPGDRVRVRIELMVDRPMEFIEMKDMRGSGLEPLDVLSKYKYQDGLGYYQSTKDVATYFYFERVAKGKYVFEYDLFASHSGQFSNGICQIQSYYAPEFGSHSEGVRLKIE